MSNLDFITALWLFMLMFILHELEEWNIVRWYYRHYVDLPPITARSTRTWILFIIAVGILWCLLATLPSDPSFAAYVLFPAIAITLQNALQHLWWQFSFEGYAPGIVTALLLLIPAGCGLTIWIIREDYAAPWYILLCFLVMLPGLTQTVRAGNRMTTFIRGINLLGIRLAKLLPDNGLFSKLG